MLHPTNRSNRLRSIQLQFDKAAKKEATEYWKKIVKLKKTIYEEGTFVSAKFNLYPLLPAKVVDYDDKLNKYVVELYDFEQSAENRWLTPSNSLKSPGTN